MTRENNPQRDKRTKTVRVAAAGAGSVPVLRQVVIDLCDEVDKIDERLAVLERVPRTSSGSVK